MRLAIGHPSFDDLETLERSAFGVFERPHHKLWRRRRRRFDREIASHWHATIVPFLDPCLVFMQCLGVIPATKETYLDARARSGENFFPFECVEDRLTTVLFGPYSSYSTSAESSCGFASGDGFRS